MEPNGFTRAGSNGRLTLAVPSKGRMAEPSLRLCADAGLSFETTDRSLLVPCANAPVDLLLVRAGDVPEYVQDGVVDLGITGANLVVEAAADVVKLAELGFARCTLQAAVPADAPADRAARSRPAARGDGLPRLDTNVAEAARDRRRARARLRFGRGCAAARPLRRDRRPRLDRVDGQRERPAAARRAARVAGRPRRQRGGAPEAHGARPAARADDLGRRRRPPPALPDDERAEDCARRDPVAAPGDGCAVGDRPRRAPVRSPSTRSSTRTTSGSCSRR